MVVTFLTTHCPNIPYLKHRLKGYELEVRYWAEADGFRVFVSAEKFFECVVKDRMQVDVP